MEFTSGAGGESLPLEELTTFLGNFVLCDESDIKIQKKV